MSQQRLEALQSLLAQDPNNSFVRYGLAQTLTAAGRLDDATAEYRRLLSHDPTYVAAYFHLGQVLEKAARLDEARDIYNQGLDACRLKGDSHTASEIQAALDILG